MASGENLLAGKKKISGDKFSSSKILSSFKTIHRVKYFKRLEYPWQIFQWNNEILREDVARTTAGRRSQPLPHGNQCTDIENIFIDEGASINFSVINAATGPVYIGKNCEVMEGSMIRGPVALCEGATLKMGAKVYGASTVGPYCTGGGEIKNVVMQGYSNKAHDGYLGDSVIGRWCNLGAGTSNSNVKNTGGMVKMWN